MKLEQKCVSSETFAELSTYIISHFVMAYKYIYLMTRGNKLYKNTGKCFFHPQDLQYYQK